VRDFQQIQGGQQIGMVDYSMVAKKRVVDWRGWFMVRISSRFREASRLGWWIIIRLQKNRG
ncbi:MAG: hypothetical protein ACODAD_08915, partial [Planctomycetota bacterium]